MSKDWQVDHCHMTYLKVINPWRFWFSLSNPLCEWWGRPGFPIQFTSQQLYQIQRSSFPVRFGNGQSRVWLSRWLFLHFLADLQIFATIFADFTLSPFSSLSRIIFWFPNRRHCNCWNRNHHNFRCWFKNLRTRNVPLDKVSSHNRVLSDINA